MRTLAWPSCERTAADLCNSDVVGSGKWAEITKPIITTATSDLYMLGSIQT